jgi:hypothetical protein
MREIYRRRKGDITIFNLSTHTSLPFNGKFPVGWNVQRRMKMKGGGEYYGN